MTKHAALIAVAAFCGSAAVTGLAFTAARPEARQPELAPDHPLASQFQVDEQAMMETWMKSATPGPAHAWLERFIGTWNTTFTVNMGGQESVSKGVSTYEWLMEGRFVSSTYEGDMMGMPMQGYGVTGFDNLKRQYTGIWMDSMSTGMMPMHGSLDPTGTILTMIGEMDEPSTGEMGKAVLYVTTFIDENNFKFEAKEILYGEPFTVFTIEYTRAE